MAEGSIVCSSRIILKLLHVESMEMTRSAVRKARLVWPLKFNVAQASALQQPASGSNIYTWFPVSMLSLSYSGGLRCLRLLLKCQFVAVLQFREQLLLGVLSCRFAKLFSFIIVRCFIAVLLYSHVVWTETTILFLLQLRTVYCIITMLTHWLVYFFSEKKSIRCYCINK